MNDESDPKHDDFDWAVSMKIVPGLKQEDLDWAEMAYAIGVYEKFDDREHLAFLISRGINLRRIEQSDRDLIANLVRSGKRGKGKRFQVTVGDGSKVPRFKRDLDVLMRYSLKLGFGNESPADEVAKEFSLTPKQVQNIWDEYKDQFQSDFFGPIRDEGRKARAALDLKEIIEKALEEQELNGPLRPQVVMTDVVPRSGNTTRLNGPTVDHIISVVCEERGWLIEETEAGPVAKLNP